MQRVCKAVSRQCIIGVLLCLGVGASLLAAVPAVSQLEYQFHSLVPLGIEGFSFGDSGRKFYVMAVAEQPAFEGWRQVTVDSRRVLLNAQGRQVSYYPAEVRFRVTATAWADKLSQVDITRLDGHGETDTNQFLLSLRFQLKIFRGLRARTVIPTSVGLVGMPADITYSERIYSLRFKLGRVPVEDRVVLEVLAPSGERLCKFHLDLT